MTDIALDLTSERVGAEDQAPCRAQASHARSPSTAALVVLGFAVSAGLIGSVGSFAALKGMSLAHFTRDPVSVMGGPAYIGVLSNVGIVLWISAATAALTVGLLAVQIGCSMVTRNFLLATGLMTLMLGLDDLFLLHEDVLPRLGVAQNGILLAYLGLGSLYALLYRRQILGGRVTLFMLAGTFLSASLATDFLFRFSDTEASLEDAAKLTGIVFWFLFVISYVAALRESHPPSTLTRRLAELKP